MTRNKMKSKWNSSRKSECKGRGKSKFNSSGKSECKGRGKSKSNISGKSKCKGRGKSKCNSSGKSECKGRRKSKCIALPGGGILGCGGGGGGPHAPATSWPQFIIRRQRKKPKISKKAEREESLDWLITVVGLQICVSASKLKTDLKVKKSWMWKCYLARKRSKTSHK